MLNRICCLQSSKQIQFVENSYSVVVCIRWDRNQGFYFSFFFNSFGSNGSSVSPSVNSRATYDLSSCIEITGTRNCPLLIAESTQYPRSQLTRDFLLNFSALAKYFLIHKETLRAAAERYEACRLFQIFSDSSAASNLSQTAAGVLFSFVPLDYFI